MDINSMTNNNAATMSIKPNTNHAIGTAVASKALGVQAESAGQLNDSVAKSTASETHLGNTINTYA